MVLFAGRGIEPITNSILNRPSGPMAQLMEKDSIFIISLSDVALSMSAWILFKAARSWALYISTV